MGRSVQELEDNAQEIKKNPDGSVTFFFDEPGSDPATGLPPTSSITISQADYEAGQKDPTLKF